jgi:UDP-N-acetylmuramoyl-L-alanyl-D-glutamate--2,6-diaminopimelate ligase
VRERIVNIDSDFGAALAHRCTDNVVTVSTRFDRAANDRPFVFARSIVARPDASDVRFESSWGGGLVHVPLPGEFNVANAMLALAYLLCRGVEPESACAALAGVQAPPGRMQRVGASRTPAVYVDYAHTPDALESALSALKAHFSGRVWCVFGCGGERDAGKRPLMGRVAERGADVSVITSDNPRGEAPVAIIDDILAGMRESATATVIVDRATAVAWAIDHAADGDVVLIAGKGHEDYQLVGGERYDFDDAGIARLNLERRGEASR